MSMLLVLVIIFALLVYSIDGQGLQGPEREACNASFYKEWTDFKYEGVLSADPKFWRYQTQDFFVISNGLALELAVAKCTQQFKTLFDFKAGRSGPVDIQYSYDAICSDVCMESDLLHQQAMLYTGCNCLELSTQEGSSNFRFEGDWCKHNSARMLCDIVGYCGIWGCKLHDFMCPRYEFSKKNIELRGLGTCAQGAAYKTSRTAVVVTSLLAIALAVMGFHLIEDRR